MTGAEVGAEVGVRVTGAFVTGAEVGAEVGGCRMEVEEDRMNRPLSKINISGL